jgi:hypothetical protein
MYIRLAATSLLMLAAATAALARGTEQATAPQPTPSPIVVPTLPPSGNSQTNQIIRTATGIVTDILGRERVRLANSSHGQVSYFKKFDMQVQTGPNSYRTIHLHQGTVINPRGATPSAGATVDISGQNQSDGSLNADYITVIQ